MGNTSSRDQWAGRERLAFVERVAWWRGVVNRGDLREVFGISAAQASADLQGYQELNPTALAYNVRTKRYEARPEMACVLHVPKLEEAVGMFLGAAVPLPQVRSGGAKVDFFIPPERVAGADVERRIFLAIEQGRRVKVKYWSVNSNGVKLREIAPHALGHNGYRWHARAWCFENGDFRDFVMSRIEEAEWPGEAFQAEAADSGWERKVTVKLRPHRDLTAERKQTIERDYGMTNGRLEFEVREAMRGYVLAHLGIPNEQELPTALELVE